MSTFRRWRVKRIKQVGERSHMEGRNSFMRKKELKKDIRISLESMRKKEFVKI